MAAEHVEADESIEFLTETAEEQPVETTEQAPAQKEEPKPEPKLKPEPMRLEPELPSCIDEVDLLRSENLQLRLLLALNHQADATRVLQQKTSEAQKLNASALAWQDTLQKKYGIDFKTHMIREQDGAIIPR